VTELPPDGISDDVYDEVPQLLFAVVAINAWNRLAVTSRKRPLHSRS
jgi:hypothetical protein